jgi:hypothetical protein
VAALVFSTQAGVTATLPTAVALAAQFKTYFNREPLLNEGFSVLLVNNNTGSLTIAVGAGITALQTLPAQATVTTRVLHIIFTGVTPGAETANALVQ